MVNDTVTTALETCKRVLIEEARKYLETAPHHEVKCWIHLPIYTDDTYGLDGYWAQNTVTSLYINKETNDVMVKYNDYDEEYIDVLDECFSLGEIAKIIDELP